MNDIAKQVPPEEGGPGWWIDPGPGHNAPPLGEVLTEEARPHRERLTALLDSLNASRIDSDATSEAVATLGGMLRELREKVEADRKARAKPFDDGKAAVQTTFARGLLDPIDAAMETARKMIDAWRAVQRAAAEAERKRQADLAAEAQRQADDAAKAKEAAEAKGDLGAAISAEIAEVQARERAERLAVGEGIVRPNEPIRTHAGSATATTQKQVEITNTLHCTRWLLKMQGPALKEAIGPLVAKLARAGMDIPGVSVTAVQKTQFRPR